MGRSRTGSTLRLCSQLAAFRIRSRKPVTHLGALPAFGCAVLGACPMLEWHLRNRVDFVVAPYCLCIGLLAFGLCHVNHAICLDLKIHERQAQVAPQESALSSG